LGVFIVFEGPEGSGKSSQAKALAVDLNAAGYSVILTREPGGTILGDALRQLLLASAPIQISARSEALLYCASRAQLVEEIIKPALAKRQVVVSDRFGYSTLAYQGYGRGLDLRELESVVAFATNGLKPDLCILLDVAPEVGLGRKRGLLAAGEVGEWNRFEEEELAFHQRVRRGYLEIVSAEPEKWLVLDASLPFDELHDRIMREATILLDRKRMLRRPS